ncbi:unnamed protein product [Nesidiocoris tenuis]|uniref:FAM20 C-terminal domain-containing protein n=1 Tax=Nesidiocoris tenuis TaxID=355587 RepID=A0A6H5HAE1_9HEMI|nr:unnamed protein product [Nesidiocoris tenuis]
MCSPVRTIASSLAHTQRFKSPEITTFFIRWQMHANYCSLVKRSKKYQDESKLLNLIETSIFDFLIDNGDRHHYERFASGGPVLLIDNGKR